MTRSPALKDSAKERARRLKNARQKRYRERHYKEELERNQAWRDKNREFIRQWYRDYYAQNKVAIMAQRRRNEASKGKSKR